MKKKLIFVFSVVAVLALALTLVACKQHTHDYSDKFVGDENNHWIECLNDGCDRPRVEEAAHSDENKDDLCDACGRKLGWLVGISISERELSLEVNGTKQLVVYYDPSDAKHGEPKWQSDNPSVADVDRTGLVTAKFEGETTIRVSVDGHGATCTVTVSSGKVRVESVSLPDEVVVGVNEPYYLFPRILPENAFNQKVSFSSDNEEIATVDDSGKISGKKVGTVNITVTTEDGNKTATCRVTVEISVSRVIIDRENDSDIVLAVGDEIRLTAGVLPENATNKKIRWRSTNSNVATVDEDGNVFAVASGVVDIVAESWDGVCSDRIVVEVASPVTGVRFEETEMTLELGDTATLSPVFTPANPTNQNVTWESSDENVVTVDENGSLTGIDEGTAYVTVTTEEGNFQDTTVLITVRHYLTFQKDEGEEAYYVTGLQGVYNSSFVKIPATYKGLPVTGIWESPYSIGGNEYKISGIQLPASIKWIATQLFYHTRYNSYIKYEGTLEQWVRIEGLSMVHTGNSVSSILINCDDEDSKIELMSTEMANTELVIPDGVERIEAYAFYKTNVRKISLPASLKYLGQNAFGRTDGSCMEVEFRGTLDQWVQIEGWKNANVHASSCTDVTVDGVKLNEMTEIEIDAPKIGAEAFYNGNRNPNVFVNPVWKNESLVTVVLSDRVTEIEADAFKYCVNLTDLVIGTGMTKIVDTFEYTGLERVFYRGTAEEWAEVEKPSSYYYSPFYKNPNENTATVYFYSADTPTEEGNYWYMDNGNIVIW